MNVNRLSTNNNVAQQFQKTSGRKPLQESPTAYKDKPISKIANTNQTPDENKGMWTKVGTIISITIMVIFSISNVLFRLLTVFWRYLLNCKLLTLSYTRKNITMAQKSKATSCFLELNVRCLSYHIDEHKVLLASFNRKPDVILLEETWMTVNDETSDYKLEGYQPIEANPRKKAQRCSGGVAFYVRNDLHYTPV